MNVPTWVRSRYCIVGLTWLRAGYGVVLARWPAQVVAAYSGRPARSLDAGVARALGVRQVLQAIGCSGAPTRPVLLLGAEADVAHLSSMLALAASCRSRRRASLVDALVAGLFAVAGAVLASWAPQCRQARGDGALAALYRRRDRAAAALAARVLPSWIAGAVSGTGLRSV